MKKIFVTLCFLSLIMLLSPLCRIKSVSKETVESNTINQLEKVEQEDNFRVLNKETGEISLLSAQDYIFGVVAAEMPALYEEEALKAQAVAAYTYACRKREGNKNADYDISTDFSTDQSYASDTSLKEKWGDNTDLYTQKIKKAVNEVIGCKVTYNNQLANTVYHALSSGKTESCKEVWGTDVPYLQSVSSVWDKQAADYKVISAFSLEQLTELLKENLDLNANEAIGKVEKTESGLVKSIEIFGSEYSGEGVRELFGLRSQSFTVEYKDNSIIFTTYGYGHGVGMSQFGANEMAKQGSDYKEILTYYYKGCTIEE